MDSLKPCTLVKYTLNRIIQIILKMAVAQQLCLLINPEPKDVNGQSPEEVKTYTSSDFSKLQPHAFVVYKPCC